MPDWVACLGYDLDLFCFQFIGGKRGFSCKTLMTSFSSSIVMGYGTASKAFVKVMEHKRNGINRCSKVPSFFD